MFHIDKSNMYASRKQSEVMMHMSIHNIGYKLPPSTILPNYLQSSPVKSFQLKLPTSMPSFSSFLTFWALRVSF